MTSKPRSSDVLVIGGGVIGLAVALALREAGRSVTLLERGYPGGEASWASAGLVDPGSPARDDPLAQLRQQSCELYPGWIERLRSTCEIDPEFFTCGSLDLIVDDNQDAAADKRVAAAAGATIAGGAPALERLSAADARALEPGLRADLRGALLDRRVAQVRPPRLLQALRRACERVGVGLELFADVRELIVANERVEGARLAEGTQFHAGKTVLAAGAWCSALHPRLPAVLPVVPVRGQMALLSPNDGAGPRHVIEAGQHYLVPRRDGALLVGATVERDAGFEVCNTAGGVRSVLAAGQRAWPALDEATLLRCWAGLRPATPDSAPHLGPVPGLRNLVAATGHFRSGIVLTPITAQLMTAHLDDDEWPAALANFAPGRALANR